MQKGQCLLSQPRKHFEEKGEVKPKAAEASGKIKTQKPHKAAGCGHRKSHRILARAAGAE